jgi:2-aminoadipate transaminase
MSSDRSIWVEAKRTEKLSSSVVRDILKITEIPGIISFAGGLPSAKAFPVDAFKDAYASVLDNDPIGALQYGPSEGYAPLREMIADSLPWEVSPSDVLITTGSQQGLDLISKVCIDNGSSIIVEDPTFLAALQTFRLMEPEIHSVDSDENGMDLEGLRSLHRAKRARFAYMLPNFQNPTGRTMSEAARVSFMDLAREIELPVLEDNPYGELWYDEPPPAPLAARNPQGTLYLGSFSKVLAPGLRLGFMVLPKSLMAKVLQAKQAADLHTPGINQRVAHKVMSGGFIEKHIPMIRSMYKGQRDAMLSALERTFADFDSELKLSWNKPAGGMFLWAKLPEGMDATKLLPFAVKRGVAFVPGSPFFVEKPALNALRLSFVTSTQEEIERGIGLLADAIKDYSLSLK